MINLEKRKRIMKRSIKLGHCICDPKKPCPCDLLKEKDICLCAGERLDSPAGDVNLTSLVEKAGCASKIDQVFLKKVLSTLPEIDDPRVLIGSSAGDDAGVYDLGDNTVMVQTVDVFTPSVDDPYVFGQIAAANSVSDIYAMGAEPATALSIIGFPARKIPDDAMAQILRGGIDKMKEAGVSVIGGHSINDDQIKAGFAVTGFSSKDRIITSAGSKAGDKLILTKPLGTGIMTFAKQIGKASSKNIQEAIDSMAALNKTACRLMQESSANAVTDITGFSLIGHLSQMGLNSGVDIKIVFDYIPFFKGTYELAMEGVLPGAIERNKESCGHMVTASSDISEEMFDMCFDAQTSGGLLISVSPDKAGELLKNLHKEGIQKAAVIGEVTGKGTGKISLVRNSKSSVNTISLQNNLVTTNETQSENSDQCCCRDGEDGGSIDSKYSAFISAVNQPDELDAFTKQAINIALSVAMRCEPCLKTHIQKARSKGFTDKEIDESAWMGIAFGGSPAIMMYKRANSETKQN